MRKEYSKELLSKIDDLKGGLNYYIQLSEDLKNELDVVNSAYENRLDKYIKLQKEYNSLVEASKNSELLGGE